MKRLMPLKIFAVASVLSSLVLTAVVAHAGGDKTLAQIAGYREWTRVTREPVEVPGIPAGGG
jgi:hypothetical protein